MNRRLLLTKMGALFAAPTTSVSSSKRLPSKALSQSRLMDLNRKQQRSGGFRARVASVAIAWAALAAGSPLPAFSFDSAQPNRPLTAEEQAAIVPLQTMMDAFGKRDLQMVGSVFLPGSTVTLLRAGKPLQLQSDAFVTWIGGRMKATPSRVEESMHNPVVHVDHGLASVWAPYTFKLEGKVDHCGTDVATMVQQNGHWVIASLEDNSYKDCSAR